MPYGFAWGTWDDLHFHAAVWEREEKLAMIRCDVQGRKLCRLHARSDKGRQLRKKNKFAPDPHNPYEMRLRAKLDKKNAMEKKRQLKKKMQPTQN